MRDLDEFLKIRGLKISKNFQGNTRGGDDFQ